MSTIDDEMAEAAYAFARTVKIGRELHTLHLAPFDRSDHDDGPWTWTWGCKVMPTPIASLPFVGVEYDNPEDGWRAVDEWEKAGDATCTTCDGERFIYGPLPNAIGDAVSDFSTVKTACPDCNPKDTGER